MNGGQNKASPIGDLYHLPCDLDRLVCDVNHPVSREGGHCTVAETRGDKTVLRALGLGGYYGGGAQGMVDVKDGKILRVRPFHFDWKYDREKVRTWKLEKNGKVLEAHVEVASLAVFTLVQEAHLFPQQD